MLLIYFLDNKLGGVTSLNYNLAAHCTDPSTRQWVIHIDEKESDMTRANMRFPVEQEWQFGFSSRDNSYHVLRKLRKLLPDEAGALVLNYATEMAMLDHYRVDQTVFQLVHDDYNVRLAERYGHVVDAFIAHNREIYTKLQGLFPGRKNDIHYLPHGVRIPSFCRETGRGHGPLKLLFLGRMTDSKGIFDLPVISRLLVDAGVDFEWTCIGNGPKLEELKKSWQPSYPVSFISPAGNDEVLEIAAKQDIFVLPTKFEGSPVSLLETMSVGLVPVISALPGGITEIVSEETGYTPGVNDHKAFAEAIIALNRDRGKLDKMGVACREKVSMDFNVSNTAAQYHALFRRYKELYRPKELKKIPIGSRLDHPVLSNWITKAIRSFRRN